MKDAIFLDRDGTIIDDVGYIGRAEDVRLVPEAAETLGALKRDFGYLLVVVSNQSGVGRKMVTDTELRAVHDRMVELLARHNIELDGTYYCPHHPHEGCGCRKPSPGLVTRAAADLGIDLESSYLIGDRPTDAECAARAKVTAILLWGSDGREDDARSRPNTHVVGTWDEVYDLIARRRITS